MSDSRNWFIYLVDFNSLFCFGMILFDISAEANQWNVFVCVWQLHFFTMVHTKQCTDPERENKRKVIIHTIWSEERRKRRSFHWQWMKERFVIRISSFFGSKIYKMKCVRCVKKTVQRWLISHGTCTFPCLAHMHMVQFECLSFYSSYLSLSLQQSKTNDNTYIPYSMPKIITAHWFERITFI